MNWKNWKLWVALAAVVLLIVAVVLWFTLPAFRAVVAEVLINIAALSVGFGLGVWYKKKKG
jgi:hypothetical protein